MSALPFRVFRNLFFVGASEYFATRLRLRAARLMHIAPVDPDTNLTRALQAAAFGLQEKKILILFPEGERSIDGEVKKFKKGVAILSLHLQVPVIPAALDGVFEVWPRNRPLRWSAFLPWKRTRVELRFGPTIPPPAVPPTGISAAQMEAFYASFADDLRSVVVRLHDSLATFSESEAKTK
jgi:long-chain acyl-CoA synthetase